MNWFGLPLTHGINNETHISMVKPLKTFFLKIVIITR
jgi:hypothetical protein